MAVPFMKLQGNPTSEQTLRSEIWIAFPVQYHSASEVTSHVVLFDMNMCYLTWAGLAAAHTNLHEENLHHFVDDS